MRIPAFTYSFNMIKLFWGTIYVENVVQIYMDSS